MRKIVIGTIILIILSIAGIFTYVGVSNYNEYQQAAEFVSINKLPVEVVDEGLLVAQDTIDKLNEKIDIAYDVQLTELKELIEEAKSLKIDVKPILENEKITYKRIEVLKVIISTTKVNNEIASLCKELDNLGGDCKKVKGDETNLSKVKTNLKTATKEQKTINEFNELCKDANNVGVDCEGVNNYTPTIEEKIDEVTASIEAQKKASETSNNTSGSNVVSSSSNSSGTTSKQAGLLIATFNVLKPDETYMGSWSSRVGRIASAITSNMPDVIGLNEVYESYQVSDLKSLTGYAITKPIGSQPYGWSSAIGYNANKVTLINSGAYFFANQYVYTAADGYPNLTGKTASRTAVWGIFERNGIPFIFINGHTQTENDGDGTMNNKQIDELFSLASQLSNSYGIKNVYIVGDLNEVNMAYAACKSPGITYNDGDFTARFDYLCSTTNPISNLKAVTSGASDHYYVGGSTTIYN